jgi:hypothetical protein
MGLNSVMAVKAMTALAVLLAKDNGWGLGDLCAGTPETPVEE